MKVTRALLLSSRKQAEAWERASGYLLFPSSAPKTYRFLVTQGDERTLRFQIFCVHQKRDSAQHMQVVDVISPSAHVDIEFEDAGRLLNFLRRYEIDFENCWEPVEESE